MDADAHNHNNNMAANQYTPRTQKRFRTNGLQRNRPQSTLSNGDRRLARIKGKLPHEKENADLAYEEGAAIADELPQDRASIIAGALHDLPSVQSVIVLVGGVDEQDRCRWASVVVDVDGYFGEGAR